MKKNKNYLVLWLLFCMIQSSIAQVVSSESPELKYKRSSLITMLIDNEEFPKRDTVIKAYNNAPFPEKYNNHNFGVKTLTFQDFTITNEERIAFGLKPKSAFALALSKKDSSDYKNSELPLLISKYFKQNKIANKIVSKWFNRSDDGSFDMELIKERGSYDATEMEANIARSSARGLATLSDAGQELIGNTFVVCSKLKFISNEIAAVAVRDAAYKIAEERLSGFGLLAAKTAANIVYNKAKVGYTVWTHSYLFQLNWNDSIESVFYNDYWMDKNTVDVNKKEKFDNSDLFQLAYIGSANSSSVVTFSFKKGQAKRTEDEVIAFSTIRNVDHVFSKLQKEYDVFMPKVPLYSGNPITAKVGMKEGLDGGEKFAVLEQRLNSKTGLTEYNKVGEIKVNKKLIWDNRYKMGEEEINDKKKDQELDRTTFDGPNDKFFAGMLIKQIK